MQVDVSVLQTRLTDATAGQSASEAQEVTHLLFLHALRPPNLHSSSEVHIPGPSFRV